MPALACRKAFCRFKLPDVTPRIIVRLTGGGPLYYDAENMRADAQIFEWKVNGMPWFGWVLCFALALAAVFLWLAAPAGRRPQSNPFTGKLCAHRGLHDGNQTVYENSMKAFALAADAGYGMEMDVQLTLDNQLVIHHDASTARVCGKDCVIAQTAYADLPPLPDGSPVPLFADFLKLVAGRVPLIVEIKSHNRLDQTTQATLDQLKAYTGPYCIESFSPHIVRYVRRHAPGVIRGQLASGNPAAIKSKGFFHYVSHKYLLYNFMGRPHFVAFDCNHTASLSLLMDKHWFGAFLVAWTVRDQAVLNRARRLYSTWIFEGFAPDQP